VTVADVDDRSRLDADRTELLALLLAADGSQGIVAQPRTPGESLPASFAQERLWLLNQIQELGSAYNIPVSIRLVGSLDVVSLERSFGCVVERHEALRTRFAVVEGSPVQVIAPAGRFALQAEDLSMVAAGKREVAARERVAALVAVPFDLERDSLLRVHLLRLSEQEHVALVVMHHIVSDGWSMGVLVREVSALYEAFAAGRLSPLGELAIQYPDYAIWQRGWLQGELLEKQVGYWKQRLSGAPAALDLPADRTRPAVQSYRGAFHVFVLPEALTAGLNVLARSEGATLYMVLLAAFKVLLSRWSGQTDIVVGSPIAGRTHRELEGLIGFFANTLALRTELDADPTFRELLRRVKETALGAYAHQDLPFERLVAELQPVRDLSRQPVFQVLFALQNMPWEQLQLPGLQLSRMGGEPATAKFDLSLYMLERGGRIEGFFEYATDLFDAATLQRLAEHLQVLLQGIVADPQCRIGKLPLLRPTERDRLLLQWNATETDYPRDKCLHDLFMEQAAKTPDAVAVVYEGRELSYDELDRLSSQLAHHLRGLGVRAETIVGLCVERSLEMVVGLLGILKAGGAYLPMDPSYPSDRLAYMLADAKAPILLTQAAQIERLPKHDAYVVLLDADWPSIAVQPSVPPPNITLPDNLAYVIYTSGSTGKPKGVMNCHRPLVNRLLWMQSVYGLDGSDRVLQKTPFTFDVSVWEFLWPLMTGARLVVARPDGHRDPVYLTDLIARARVSTLHFVPSMLQAWLEMPQVGVRCRHVRRVICSGEALSGQLQRRFFAQIDSGLHNLYGPTEAAIDVTFWACRKEDDGNDVPIGRPIWNTKLYVLDQALQPTPIGVSGELYIGGVGLARGYLGRAGLTAEQFVPSPFGDGERLYRTGDLARWRPDGELQYLGRVDYQIKIRGYRIELGEIEAKLVEHSDVHQAVVVAREDAAIARRLVAYVVVADAAAIDVAELRAHLQRSLPEYMVPSAYVMLNALPLTPNGKIDRRALPAPDHQAVVRGEYVAPRTPTEEMLASIWAELLKLDRVGIEDNFFELGGHSLLATQLVARIRDTFHVELSLRALFETPTIAELALGIAGQFKQDPLAVSLPREMESCEAT
jgi:amino acid adenylation domain-containing protein